MMFLVLLLLLLLLVLILFIIFRESLKPRKFPPGPIWLPFIGCLLVFQKLRCKYGYVHLAFEKLCEIYGPIIGLKLGRERFVVVSGHELVKKVLLGDEFNGRPDGFFFRVRAFGARKGVLFTEGSKWSFNRRLTMKHLRAFGFGQTSMEDNLILEAEELVKNLGEQCGGGNAILMSAAFDVPVLNALWTMLAGYRFSHDDPRLENILRIVHDAFRITDTLGGLVSQLPVLRHFVPELCGHNHLMAVLEKLWSFVGEELRLHERKMRDDPDEPRNLMDAYVCEMLKDDKNFDRKEIVVLCLDLFMAGSKTTTDSLAITFAFLARNPKWLNILQRDLDDVVGRHRNPVLADAPRLPRVEAFLAETQRTQILTPLGVPHSATENVHFEGYVIPKNTTVLVNFHSAHNDEAVWDNPEEFSPQRFLDENGLFKKKNNFMHFGLGRRRCLGEVLARSSLFLFFTHVVHNFNIAVSGNDGPPSLQGTDGFVISPKPYRLVLTRRFLRSD